MYSAGLWNILRQMETFKDLPDVFISDGKQEAKLDARIVRAGRVTYQLQHLIYRREGGGEKSRKLLSSIQFPL